MPASRDRQNFPGAYRELDLLEHDATIRIRSEASVPPVETAEAGADVLSGWYEEWRKNGSLAYVGLPSESDRFTHREQERIIRLGLSRISEGSV